MGGDLETVIKGKGNKWEILHRNDESNRSIWHIESFKGKTYVSYFDDLYILDGKKLKEIDFGGAHISDFGILQTTPKKNKLIVGGRLGVYTFDGNKWRKLVGII